MCSKTNILHSQWNLNNNRLQKLSNLEFLGYVIVVRFTLLIFRGVIFALVSLRDLFEIDVRSLGGAGVVSHLLETTVAGVTLAVAGHGHDENQDADDDQEEHGQTQEQILESRGGSCAPDVCWPFLHFGPRVDPKSLQECFRILMWRIEICLVYMETVPMYKFVQQYHYTLNQTYTAYMPTVSYEALSRFHSYNFVVKQAS